MDVQLLDRWFRLGFTSREMAWFLLLGELQGEGKEVLLHAHQIQERWGEIHKEVCKKVYLLGPPE